jgi:hypothetical protein
MNRGATFEQDGLPSFKKPPVTEAILSIQFAPLPDLRGVMMGCFGIAFGMSCLL